MKEFEFVFYKLKNEDHWDQIPENVLANSLGYTDEEIVVIFRVRMGLEYLNDLKTNPVVQIKDERDSSKYSKMFEWNDFIIARWDGKDLDRMKDIERKNGVEFFISEYLEMLEQGFFVG